MRFIEKSLSLALICCAFSAAAQARICVNQFRNESFIPFKSIPSGTLIGQEGATIESEDGSYRIILEDAGKSGYHRPHWKFHVWLECKEGFAFLDKNKLLYAVVFYDGDGQVQIHIDNHGKLHVTGGTDVLYPWAIGTIGRGNPYHEIQGTEVDENGIKYFDFQGFVGLPYCPFANEDELENSPPVWD